MAKLFLKLWILILCTSFSSFWIQSKVFSWTNDSNATTNSNERFRRQFVMIGEVLRPHPQAEWQARFQDLKKKVGSPDTFLGPSELISINELRASKRLSDEQLEHIQAHKPTSLDLPSGNGYEVFHTILDSDQVVVMKAPFAIRQPMRVFGLFTPTQFTWLVESSMYALVIFFWLRLFRRDMLKLETAAAEIGDGHFDVRLDIGRGAALYPVADSFNKMRERVSALIGSHKQLTNAISHEFRTPITRLRFRHELAIEARSIPEKDGELRAMESAIDQLDELSTELLEYARLDREEPKLNIASIDVGAWFDELAAEAQEVADSLGRSLKIETRPMLDSVDADHRYLSRAVANLLRNAVRYANATVSLTMEQRGTTNVLLIDDDGPGVPLEERERLFEPFSRLDKSRDRASGGFGIGLAIVKQIARWHGGTIQIETSPLGGARLRFEWHNPSTNTAASV